MVVRFISDRLWVKAAGYCAAVVIFSAACCPGAAAQTQAYLLRGWFGVFSGGMDGMAEELRGKGIKAEAIGHLAWKATVSKIVADRAAGKTGPLALVGHSQGANNVIDMARELEKKKIPVDLLITLAPFMQDSVPANVVRALNFYQAGGWGAPLSADKGFRGRISNVDLQGDLISTHVNIDKNAKVQADIVREVVALSRRPAR
jgi:hypothetical protein